MAHVRKDGKTWYYAIDLGKVDGKRKIMKKRGFKRKQDAENAMNEVLYQLNHGTYIKPSETLYKEYLEQWLDNKQVKKRTLETYSWLVNNYIVPALGDIELSKVNSLHIEKFINDLIKSDKLSDENVQKVYTLINDSLKKAVRHELISKNVAEKVDRPKARKKDIEVWDEGNVKKFLEVAKKDRSYIVFHLALTTGMRQSEILGLRWSNVDLINGMIYVKEQIERDSTEFTDVKTKAANRSIAIDDATIKEIKKQKIRIAEEKLMLGEEYTDFNLVAPTSSGTPYNHSNIRKIFNRLIKEAKVNKIRFHDLRHTHATLLLQLNINPKIVQERLGHANVRVTLDTYSHLLPNMQKDTAKQFGQMLFSVN